MGFHTGRSLQNNNHGIIINDYAHWKTSSPGPFVTLGRKQKALGTRLLIGNRFCFMVVEKIDVIRLNC